MINADGTGRTGLNSGMPAEMRPDRVTLLLLNDDGSRLLARHQFILYYIDLPGSTWSLFAEGLYNMGGHKEYMINAAGTRAYFEHDAGWNPVTEKYDQGIYYVDAGGSPVSFVDLAELPPATATPMNMLDLVGNAPDGTVLFTWNEDYYTAGSVGLWMAGPVGGPTRVDSETHNYMYHVQNDLMPNKILSTDASVALYHWGTDDYENYLDLINTSTGVATTLASNTGLNGLYNIALSGDGRYARYGMPLISSAIHNLETGDRRESIPYYTSFTTWGTELSDLTYDGRYQYHTDRDFHKIYKTDFRPGAGPYTAAASISAIGFSAQELPNDGATTIKVTATVSDPQGLATIASVKWILLIDGHEHTGGNNPIYSNSYWLYDDGTTGDEVAGDGVFTKGEIRTSTGSSEYDDLTLPYAFGFRVVVTDGDGNHTVADSTLTVVAP